MGTVTSNSSLKVAPVGRWRPQRRGAFYVGRLRSSQMVENVAPLLSHISNGGIVQLPGCAFPGIVMLGDSVGNRMDLYPGI